ncbi:MAG: hypothetical protein J7474_04625 [Arthrobacter sp.]|nr:hypothetical protein [Arthrobacter sp.]
MLCTVALVVPGVIVGSAFADLVARPVAGHRRSLNRALEIAGEAAPRWTIRWWRPGNLSTNPDDAKATLFVIGIVVIVAVGRFAQYVGEIAYGLVLFSAVVFGGTVLSFFVFWMKRCVDGRSVVWRILLSSVLWTTGLFNAYWLQNAPFHGDAVGRLGALVKEHGPIGAFFKEPDGAFLQVAVQMIGAILCVMMLIVFVALCLASISGIYIASHGRPRWFWLALFGVNRWAVRLRVWIIAVILGFTALACVSGAAFDGGEALIRWFGSLPSAPPTPA